MKSNSGPLILITREPPLYNRGATLLPLKIFFFFYKFNCLALQRLIGPSDLHVAITWQRGGGRLGAGGAQELDVGGVKPASLTLLASSLDRREKERVRGNHILSGSLLNVKKPAS